MGGFTLIDSSSLILPKPFVLLAKNARGASAAGLIGQAIGAPGLFVFSELLECVGVKEVCLAVYSLYLGWWADSLSLSLTSLPTTSNTPRIIDCFNSLRMELGRITFVRLDLPLALMSYHLADYCVIDQVTRLHYLS